MNTATLPTECPDCGEPREDRTCSDCGAQAAVIDCGHYEQPAEIAASQYMPYEYVCERCEKAHGEAKRNSYN